MTRSQLEHAIRAACAVSHDTELWVFGSQAILGSCPDAPADVRTSIEVDIQPKNVPEAVNAIDGALGELSQFHRTHGFYVHGVSIESASLPAGWEQRVAEVSHPVGTAGNTGLCVEPHDLAASKLAENRDKDREFVRALLRDRLVESGMLGKRIAQMDVDASARDAMLRWVEVTANALRQ